MLHKLLSPFLRQRKINTREFAIAPFFAGDNLGPLFTVTGKTRSPINAKQWRDVEGAILVAPQQLPIQVIGLGSLINGSYNSQPLAIPTNNGQ